MKADRHGWVQDDMAVVLEAVQALSAGQRKCSYGCVDYESHFVPLLTSEKYGFRLLEKRNDCVSPRAETHEDIGMDGGSSEGEVRVFPSRTCDEGIWHYVLGKTDTAAGGGGR